MMKKEPLFGNTVAQFRVIPSQKSGLLHVQGIVFQGCLSRKMLDSPQNIDRIISTELPREKEPHIQNNFSET